MDHRFIDAATISGARKTADGYLIAEAFAVRTGIQNYSGSEVGLMDRDVVRVYRPEDEVRATESLRTFSHAPITLGHPDKVTADNWRDLAKGEVSTEAEWDGNKIKLPLIVKDAEAIAAIEAGTRELSAGYTCALDFTDGVTPDGEAYDAVQRNIRINHIAIVPRGRAGSECRIGDADARWGASPITFDRKDDDMTDNVKTRTVLIDGLSVETTDAGAHALEKLQKDMAAQAKALSDAEAKHDKAIADKDAEIDKIKGQLDAANEKILDDAALDQRVADRAELIGKAGSIAKDVAVKGLSDADIRKAVVTKVLGDAAVADKSDAYIEARFDVLAEDAAKGADTFNDAAKGGTQSPITNDGWDKIVTMKKEA